MGCYTIPAAAAIIHFFLRKKKPSWNTQEHRWLNLLFGGAAIFGVVDHAWNHELLAFSVHDVLLGAFITITIYAAWGIMLLVERSKAVTTVKSDS